MFLIILKATPLVTKENEARMKLHKPFTFQSINLYIRLVLQQAPAYDCSSQQIVLYTKKGEKLSQHSGNSEAFTQLKKQAPGFPWSKI